MKKFIQIISMLVILASLSACQTGPTFNQSNYRGVGSTGQVYNQAAAAPTNSDLSVFGNQPQEPTDAALANITTWGAVYGDVSGWNELRPSPRARVQNIGTQTPILFDRKNGWAWKQACHNRVRPYVAPAVTQQQEPGNQSNQAVVQQSQSFQFNLVVPVSINGQPIGGCYRQPQQQCVRVPVRDNCGRIVGWRMVPAGGGYGGGTYFAPAPRYGGTYFQPARY